jgi:hypothetical protein
MDLLSFQLNLNKKLYNFLYNLEQKIAIKANEIFQHL